MARLRAPPLRAPARRDKNPAPHRGPPPRCRCGPESPSYRSLHDVVDGRVGIDLPGGDAIEDAIELTGAKNAALDVLNEALSQKLTESILGSRTSPRLL